MRLSTKLPVAIIGLVVVSVVVTGLIASIQVESGLQRLARAELTAVREARVSALQSFLNAIETDVRLLAANDMVIDALTSFESGIEALGNEAGERLRRLYIDDNPHPAVERDRLRDPGDGSAYSAAHARYHEWFRRLQTQRGYYDVFLIDHGGTVVYSVSKEQDFVARLTDGPWRETDLAAVYRQATERSQANTTAFSDFAPYAPSGGAAASFIAAPVFDHTGEPHGALVFQMPIGSINTIMQSTTGLGETGETYIVGSDLLMRSDSRFSETTTILNRRVETAMAREALAGRSGVMTGLDHRGVDVLSAYAPVEFQGTRWAVLAEMDVAEIDRPAIDIRNMLGLAMVAIVGGAVVVGLLLARSIGRPVAVLTKAMGELAANRLDVEVPGRERSDELGEMACAVQVFKDNALDKQRRDQEDRQRLEREAVTEAERKHREKAMGDEIATLVAAVADGDLSKRLDVSAKDGFYRSLSDDLNRLTETMAGLIADVGDALGSMAQGDLTRRLDKSYQGAFARIQSDFNTTSAKLADILAQVGAATQTISAAATEVATGSADLSERTEQQASNLEETAASMEQLGATVRTNADNADRASAKAVDARQVAAEGSRIADAAVEAIQRIEQASKKITDIISVIDEIAFQTNLLALNAAVEAARAGDAGKGFAVVAQEVRILAQRSAQASREIKGLILDSDTQVHNGVDMVQRAGSALEGIVNAVNEVSEVIQDFTAASKQQATAIDEINAAVSQLDEMTQKNAALVEQATAAAQALDTQAQQQRTLIAFFQLDTAPATPPDRPTAPVVRSRQTEPAASAAPRRQIVATSGAGWARTTKPKPPATKAKPAATSRAAAPGTPVAKPDPTPVRKAAALPARKAATETPARTVAPAKSRDAVETLRHASADDDDWKEF